MPRIVRCSIIQASNAVPATEPLAVQKQAMIEKHLGLIRKAAAELRRYRGLSLRNGLVLAQISASLMLLLLTGFMVIGFHRTAGIDPGFDPRNLYLISLD